MRKIKTMLISTLFTASAILASPTLDKSDSQILFGQKQVNIVTLSHDEMKNTNGNSLFRLNSLLRRWMYPEAIIMPEGYPLYRQKSSWGYYYF